MKLSTMNLSRFSVCTPSALHSVFLRRMGGAVAVEQLRESFCLHPSMLTIMLLMLPLFYSPVL